MHVLDIETNPVFYAGVYDINNKEYKDYTLDEFKVWLKDNIETSGWDFDNRNINNAWILHNFEGFDKFILADIIEKDASEDDLKELTDVIISGEKLKKFWNNNYAIDTMKYVKKSLKDYAIEHDLETSKFDFDNNTNVDELRKYLKEDVMNTYHMYENYVKKEINNTYTAYSTAGFKIDWSKVTSNFTSSRVLAPELVGKDKSGQVDGDYEFNYPDLINFKDANEWYKKIHWTGDGYLNGKNGDLKELVFNYLDNEMVSGFGGFHSHNKRKEFIDNIYHLDISSYYPHLIKMLLERDFGIRATIDDKYFYIMDKRLELKGLGDPASNSLKLFINSIYGLLAAKGYETKIHNPVLQAMVCLTGQYEMLHLLDMLLEDGLDYNLIQANTDGIIIQTKDIDKLNKVKDEWESYNNGYLTFDIDAINYYYGEDVNNYFLRYENGKIKAKGRFKFEYNVNTKYDEIRHNLAINKLIINNKLGEDVLEIKDSDYAITPNNRTKDFLGSQKLYLTEDGSWYLNKNHESLHMPYDIPILVTDNFERINKDYYKAIALRDGSTIENYSLIKDTVEWYGEKFKVRPSGWGKNNLSTQQLKIPNVGNTILSGGRLLENTKKLIVFDFDIDTQEQLDNLPEELRNIYDNSGVMVKTCNEFGPIGFRRKCILKVNDIKSPAIKVSHSTIKRIPSGDWYADIETLVNHYENVEIFHNAKRPKIYGSKTKDSWYNIFEDDDGITTLDPDFENTLRELTKSIKEQTIKKNNDATENAIEKGLEVLERGRIDYGFCSEDITHRGYPYRNANGEVVKYCCLHASCINYDDDCGVKTDEVIKEVKENPFVIKEEEVVEDTNKICGIDKELIDKFEKSADAIFTLKVFFEKKDGEISSKDAPKEDKKVRMEMLIIEFAESNIYRKNNFLDVKYYKEILKIVHFSAKFYEFNKIVQYFEKYSQNIELSWWGDEIKVPEIDGYDEKNNLFYRMLRNLSSQDNHTYNQLRFLIHSVFNKRANRDESVFILNGSGGNGKGFITIVLATLLEPHSTPLIGSMKASDPNILLEGKTGSSSSNFVINRVNELGATGKLNNLLKDWYEQQTYRVMNMNEERTYYRLSIPILVSNHDFTMSGTDSVKRRQVRIEFKGTLKELSTKNNPLWAKDLKEKFELSNIKEEFINDFWQYVTYVKNLDLERPEQSTKDIEAMAKDVSAVCTAARELGIDGINEIKIKDGLESYVEEIAGFKVGIRRITNILSNELGWITYSTHNKELGRSVRMYKEKE